MFLSIIVPTYNEAKNILPFLKAVKSAVRIKDFEIIFVDDNSTDRTYKIVKDLSKKFSMVRCIRRIGRRGLSSAVIEGCLSSSSKFLLIMDADLQHDENKICKMLDLIENENLDLVIGSRFLTESKTVGMSKARNKISKLANFLANKISGVYLSDPMSGFFIIKRSTFEEVVSDLSGIGFKILLDIFSSSKKQLKFKEIQFTFKPRKFGDSKLDTLVIWEYFMMLWDGKFGKIISSRFLSFCIIGGTGVFVHLLCLYLLKNTGVSFFYSQIFATLVAMTSNFFLNNLLTYRDRRKSGLKAVYALFLFYGTCGLGATANVGIANFFYQENITNISGIWYLSGLLGAFVGTIWNFLMSSLVTWKIK